MMSVTMSFAIVILTAIAFDQYFFENAKLKAVACALVVLVLIVLLFRGL